MYTKVRPRSTCLHQLKIKSEISSAAEFLQKMEGVVFWQRGSTNALFYEFREPYK